MGVLKREVSKELHYIMFSHRSNGLGYFYLYEWEGGKKVGKDKSSVQEGA